MSDRSDSRCLEWVCGDVAVLACQVPNLASLRLSIVTRWDLATNERVEMTKSFSAVAVGRNWLVVDMVHYRILISCCLTNIYTELATYRMAPTKRWETRKD